MYWSDPSGANSENFFDNNGGIKPGYYSGDDVKELFKILSGKPDSSASAEEEVKEVYEVNMKPNEMGGPIGIDGGPRNGVEDNIYVNTKNKTVQVKNTGDNFDRIYVDGKEVLVTKRGLLGAELRHAGYDISTIGPEGLGMGLTDLVLDAFNIISGGMLIKKGVTVLSKKRLGLKVGLGASEGTLESSVYFTRTLNINTKMPLRLPTIMGKPTSNLGIFLGRNSVLFGTMQADGGIYGRTK